MVTNPDKYWKVFSKAGADILMFHYESPVNLKKCFREVKEAGKSYGMVINPDTPFSAVSDLLSEAEILLIMTVYPGFSGQGFINGMTQKIREAREYIYENSLDTQIEIDGGINNNTGQIAVDSGADILVSASYIYGGDIRKNISNLKNIARSKT
jgi:ribulose-phosphate 3-epimerase